MTAADLRERVLEIARGEMGQSDEYRYTTPELGYKTAGHLSWCGIFALWCYRRAGLARDEERWILRSGFASTHLRQVAPKDAEPADLLYFNQFNHHSLLESHDGSYIWTVDGNGLGGVVVRRRRPLSDVAAAYSVRAWVERALEGGPPVVGEYEPAPAPTPAHVLQRGLRASGYDPGPIDGIVGGRTKSALLSWALAHPERVT